MTQAVDDAAIESAVPAPDPMLPRPFRVFGRREDTADTVTLELRPLDGAAPPFEPGQFNMLGRLGVGEVPISISGDPTDATLVHTIRDVGGVTRVLAAAQVGDVLEVRGPYGSGWGVHDGHGGDVVVVAGGIGLAPLRPVMLRLLAERSRYRKVALVYGARTPADQLYADEFAQWREHGIDVETIVDRGPAGWRGHVGLVTTLVPRIDVEASQTLALVCGPEVMMRYVARALIERGVPSERIRVSMERNMKCGVGVCGHCQLRQFFLCVDGPVLDYSTLAPLLDVREV